jgi:para-nitrobenzyl esterase
MTFYAALRFRFFLVFFLFGSLCLKAQVTKNSLDVVRVEGGLISGSVSGSVHIFKGVPFAAPPVGDLRWKEPQPVTSWSGTKTCTTFGASPIQNDPKPFMMWSEEFITPPKPLSEDCLYLNIWTAAKTSQEKLPVLVWIHGGAFTSGSGACAIYDGESIAKEGIVYVSINYRLGVFGFLAHPELTAESPHKSSGNYGLMDQIAALKWIKKNISAFGGDPDRVTIAGQSAGSMSVQALVASPLCKGLFKGAIAESGAMGGRRPSVSLNAAEKNGSALSAKVNSNDLKVMRRLSADSLLALGNSLPFGSFFPITDGYVLPEDGPKIFEGRQHNDVALMAGWVTGDAALMGPGLPADKFKATADNYESRKEDFLLLFPSDTEQTSTESQQKLAIIQFAALPYHRWATVNKTPCYIYQFSYVPTDKPGFPNYGAFHTSEVPFALHTLKKWDRPWKDEDYAVEKSMTAYWVNFVKTGNPNGKGLPQWKPYTKTEGNFMEFSKQPSPHAELFAKEFQFFESIRK